MNVSGQSAISNIQFTAFGPIKQWTAGGKTYSRTFNLDGEIVGITNAAGTTTYARDLAGQIVSRSDGEGYSYDAVGRLIGYAGAAGDQSYDYDLNGNRIDQLLGGNGLMFDYLNGNNQLSDIQGLTNAYTYDAAGNMTANGTLTFTYNTWGRLATVKQGTSTKATYRYNAFGQRVSKVAGSTTTYYVYDDSGLLLGEYNSSGTAVQEFLWLDGLPAMILTPSANYYVHPDHLGTPRLVYNSTGKIIWRWNSDPFGATPANEDPDGDKVKFTFNLRFPGQYFDKESNLHYNYFRDYDPSIGRYVQSDPIGLKGGWNVYGYAKGNPLSKYDTLGLFVNGDYDLSSGQLTLTDPSSGKTVTIPAESGGKPFGDPISRGEYDILERQGRPDFYRLDKRDSSPYDDTDNDAGRGQYRLHRPGRTTGCIAAKDQKGWKEVDDLIKNTKDTDQVPDNFKPWWKFWQTTPGSITRYGTITVH
ncbi:MAG: RHS repeat protein [Sulfuricella sp.]|nr:RHS repeat protein [Sulfuricella sp.]